MIQQTELHHGFQATIGELFDYLNGLDAEYLHSRTSFLYEVTGWDQPEELITANQYAIPFLESHPEHIRVYSLHMNPSEHSLYLLKQLKFSKFEVQVAFHDTPNIDTYLQYVRVENLNFHMLSSNPYAFPFLRKHLDKVDWATFSKNPEAMDLLEYYSDRISYHYLSANPNPRAIAILRQNLDQICWELLSQNPCNEAIQLLEEYPENIDFRGLSENTNDLAIDLLLRQGIENVCWWGVSRNPCNKAVELLQNHPDKIKWHTLCIYAKTKRQFELLRNHPDKIVWDSFCMNTHPLAIDLLLEHQNEILWWYTLCDQNIFETLTTYDYAGIRGVRRDLHEEYHAKMGHPSRICKWKDWGFDDFPVCEMEEDEN